MKINKSFLLIAMTFFASSVNAQNFVRPEAIYSLEGDANTKLVVFNFRSIYWLNENTFIELQATSIRNNTTTIIDQRIPDNLPYDLILKIKFNDQVATLNYNGQQILFNKDSSEEIENIFEKIKSNSLTIQSLPFAAWMYFAMEDGTKILVTTNIGREAMSPIGTKVYILRGLDIKKLNVTEIRVPNPQIAGEIRLEDGSKLKIPFPGNAQEPQFQVPRYDGKDGTINLTKLPLTSVEDSIISELALARSKKSSQSPLSLFFKLNACKNLFTSPL